ncbi:MAG: alpha/beta fold hydrolase [Gloeobacteraceae cyanobacterium ES-bin-144]|nr:alpha/beta fold hydrolase [Verrucomicrobiales bacterium]
MKSKFFIAPLIAALAMTGCVSTTIPSEEGEHRSAVAHLKQAGEQVLTPEQRAVLYLDSAKEASALLGSKSSGEAATEIYNKAATDLTVLLRSANQGRMWNRSLTLVSGGTKYNLRFTKENRDGVWNPSYFTSFTPASEVELKTIKHRNHQDGIGGALVGVRKTATLEAFSPLVGVTAPVTAVLDFKGNDVVLTLIDPSKKTKTSMAGRERSLEADFSAPLAYYPQPSETWEGLMGAIRVSDYMKTTGLYMLQPYDPDRIPLIFIHGLISTGRMWRNVINEVESNPDLRGRYQCLVFNYPTGNPPLYSALRLREELEKFRQLHPNSKDYVLVGHSMGGLLTRAQVTTLERRDWDVIGKDKASILFSKVKTGSLMDRACIFRANPKVDFAVFICTPHRGSELALSGIGSLGMRLISLPLDLTTSIAGSIGDSLSVITNDSKRMPNSVSGLSPKNPTLKLFDTLPMEVPYHSIIGDRGKGDTPNSSDGVVEYWSSHQAKAKSEKIVPGPHGACELPETIEELRRILLLHLSNR